MSPFRIPAVVTGAAAALSLLACTAGCGFLSHDPVLVAHVQIREYETDGSGVAFDSTLDRAPDGVPAWLVRDSTIVAVEHAHAGRLEFVVPPGRYRLLVGPTVACSDTIGAVELERGQTVTWPATVVLGQAGAMHVGNNPSTVGSFTIWISTSQSWRLQLNVCSLDGTVVRRLDDAVYSSGMHTIAWDRADDQGVAVPNGRYWLTLEHLPVPATDRGAPPGGGGAIGSPRRGERTTVTCE